MQSADALFFGQGHETGARALEFAAAGRIFLVGSGSSVIKPTSDYQPRRFAVIRAVFLMAAIVLTFAVASSVKAQAVSPMQRGLAELNAGRYWQALSNFQQVAHAAPSNVQARYCLAVCYHQLGKTAEATAEYDWVLRNTNEPTILRRARKAIADLGVVQGRSVATNASAPSWMTSPSSGGADSESTEAATAGGTAATHPTAHLNPRPQSTGAGPRVATPSPAASSSGTPRIVDVYTDWCGWCKKFEPTFEQGRAKFAGKISFDRMNAETPENKPFCEQYQVTGYPTLLFFDGSGQLVERINGCPKTFEAFEQRIIRAFPSL